MKMYVLVRKDLTDPQGNLSGSYVATQACHAVAQFVLSRSAPTDGWDDYMILLWVKNERELLKWHRKLKGPNELFREPDIGNSATALATLAEPKTFKRLRLLEL